MKEFHCDLWNGYYLTEKRLKMGVLWRKNVRLFDDLTVNRKPFKPVYGYGLTGLNRFGPLRLIDHPSTGQS